MAVNFSKNQEEIIRAWRSVVDASQEARWALFGYEGNTNNIHVMQVGSQGLDELVQLFNCSLIQYAFCRVLNKDIGINKLILINWQGESSPLSRKGLCASHVSDVVNYFKGCSQTITIRNEDEATKEYILEQVMKTSASKVNLNWNSQPPPKVEEDKKQEPVSSFKRSDIESEIAAGRKSFWQQQEEEEKERLEAEKKRAAEKQAQFERERKLREEHETRKLDEAIRERDRLIEATKQTDRSESSSGSQPSSMLSSTEAADDDGRVGRRSELIRLERNQETQSLISKGSIKNKRAIFEQAQQQQQNSQQPTLVRRTSGAMIAQRVNTLKSLESGNSNTSSENIEKLANGFVKVNVDRDESANVATKAVSPVKKEIEPVKFTRDQHELESSSKASTTVVSDSVPEPKLDQDSSKVDVKDSSPVVPKNDSDKVESISHDVDEHSDAKRETEVLAVAQTPEPVANGKHDIQAVALYDYQAADNTEISFDPDDIIGSIQKVDPGWWHGKVMNGKHKGQIGLFPANYVQEI